MIEAQEQLKAFEVSEWHLLKNDTRQSKHRRLFNIAFPQEAEKKETITIADLGRLLGR